MPTINGAAFTLGRWLPTPVFAVSVLMDWSERQAGAQRDDTCQLPAADNLICQSVCSTQKLLTSPYRQLIIEAPREGMRHIVVADTAIRAEPRHRRAALLRSVVDAF